jgi:hypothetical protein
LNLKRRHQLNPARVLGDLNSRQTMMPREQVADQERVPARQQFIEKQLFPCCHPRRESRHQGIQLAELSAIAPAGSTARGR